MRWPCDLRRVYAASRFMELSVRIPLKEWMFVSCGWFLGSGPYDELIPCSDNSYCVCVCVCVRVCLHVCLCLIACDLETSTVSRPVAPLCLWRRKKSADKIH
jgi:hypothetical protein